MQTSSKYDVPQSVFDSPLATRIAKKGHKEACEELARTPAHMLDESNPNHPKHSEIFGYAEKTLLSMQYKRVA
jgi:hypothetical protein